MGIGRRPGCGGRRRGGGGIGRDAARGGSRRGGGHRGDHGAAVNADEGGHDIAGQAGILHFVEGFARDDGGGRENLHFGAPIQLHHAVGLHAGAFPEIRPAIGNDANGHTGNDRSGGDHGGGRALGPGSDLLFRQGTEIVPVNETDVGAGSGAGPAFRMGGLHLVPVDVLRVRLSQNGAYGILGKVKPDLRVAAGLLPHVHAAGGNDPQRFRPGGGMEARGRPQGEKQAQDQK